MVEINDFRENKLRFENVDLSKIFDKNIDKLLDCPKEKTFDPNCHHAQGYELFCKCYVFEINGKEKKFITINDLIFSFNMSDKLYNSILDNYDGITPIEDLFYSYENELKGIINSADDLEALLLSGEFESMGELLGAPSWVINDILEVYNKYDRNSNIRYLDLLQYLVVDYDDFINAVPYALNENVLSGLGYFNIDLAKEVMGDLIKSNINLYMITEILASIPYLDEEHRLDIKDLPISIKPMGTINNLKDFDYKSLVADIKELM